MVAFLFLSGIGKGISDYLERPLGDINLGLIDNDGNTSFVETLEKRSDFIVEKNLSESEMKEAVRKGKLDYALIIPTGFSGTTNRGETGVLTIVAKGASGPKRLNDIIYDFEQGIIDKRLDSLSLSAQILNPVRIEIDDTSDYFKTIDRAIRNYLSVFLIVFGFSGLIFPSVIIYSAVRDRVGFWAYPAWDRWIGASVMGLISAMIAVLGFKASLSFYPEHPVMLKALFDNYLFSGQVFHMVWILLLSHTFWAGVLALAATRTEKPWGAFGICYFVWTLFIAALVIIAGVGGGPSGFWAAALPVADVVNAGQLITGKDMTLGTAGITLFGFAIYAVIGYFLARQGTRETS